MDSHGGTDDFYRLVWPHSATLLRTAYLLSRNHTDAEDLTQEAMLKAFRSLDSLQDESRIKPWLMSILRHCHTDRVRAAKPDELSLDQLDFDPPDRNPPETPDLSDLWHEPEEVMRLFSDEQIIAALQALPKDIRWTLLLVDIEGLDDAETAAVLDIPTGTIKSRLHRGRSMLRAALAPLLSEQSSTTNIH